MQQALTGVFTMKCGKPDFTAVPTAIGAFLRVKYDSTYGLALAGASDEALGTLAEPIVITGLGKNNQAAIVSAVFPGVIKAIASGVIAVDGDVYAGATGMVAGTGSIRLGRNVGAATTTSGDIVYYVPFINAATVAGPLSATATTGNTFTIDSDGNATVLTPAGSATITLPSATSTLATLALAETLTSKTLTTPVINWLYGTGAHAAANSLLMGGGASGYPCTTAVASKNFVEFRCESTATSGDNRLLYLRYLAGGAGTGNFDCIRACTQCTAAVAVARGGDFGVEVLATGYVTGTAYGLRSQCYVQGIIPAGGEYYGHIAEMYFDASATIAAPTAHAILCLAASGDASAAATCLNAIAFVGGASSSGGQMISPGSSMSTVTGTIRVLINNAVRYIPYYSHEGHA
jgi:hypothetical protein